jgi:hypothetical protein
VKILWLIPAQMAELLAGRPRPEEVLLNLSLASARLRLGVAASYSRLKRHANIFLNPEMAGAANHPVLVEVDVCVITKFTRSDSVAAWLGVLHRLRELNKPIVADVCEFPFDDPVRAAVGEFYTAALPQTDVLTANSTWMLSTLQGHCPRKAVLIEDAILEPPRAPRFSPTRPLKLLWFGHESNIGYLRDQLPSLAALAREHPVQLTVVSSDVAKKMLLSALEQGAAKGLEILFSLWSPVGQRRAMADCDLVLIPGDPGNPRKAGVSSNRLAEALQAGRYPIASPMQSYLPYRDVAWVDSDLIAGIRNALAHPAQIMNRLQAGQARVNAALTPDSIGRQWMAVQERAIAGR